MGGRGKGAYFSSYLDQKQGFVQAISRWTSFVSTSQSRHRAQHSELNFKPIIVDINIVVIGVGGLR